MRNIFLRSIILLLFSLMMMLITSLSNATTQDKHEKNRQTLKASPTSTEEKKETTPAQESSSTDSPVSGTFAITSNYIFRGVSQSNNIPAFQGGLTYTFLTTGIYLSTWGSNVYMPITTPFTVATVEIDTNIGITNSINDNTKYDLHLVRYFYPKATTFQYNELIGSLTFHFLTGLIGYSNNVFNSGGSGTYYNLAANVDIPSKYVYFENVSLIGAIGHYDLVKKAGKSYNDYSISLNKVIKNYTLTAQWTNTSHRLTHNSLDSAHFLGTVTATF